MTPRDLYFLTYHQAAHLVTAIVLGCGFDYVEIGTPLNLVGLDLEAASLADTETICAAGFEMEIILGRMHDTAWGRASDDRVLLGSIHADRTGDKLTSAELDERFTSGAASSRAVLQHKGTRSAIDQLSELLTDAHQSGERRVAAQDLKGVTGLLTGVAAQV